MNKAIAADLRQVLGHIDALTARPEKLKEYIIKRKQLTETRYNVSVFRIRFLIFITHSPQNESHQVELLYGCGGRHN